MSDLSQYGILEGALGSSPLRVVLEQDVLLTAQSVDIKMDAADFEVTEIDPLMNKVGGDHYSHPKALAVAKQSSIPVCSGLVDVAPGTTATISGSTEGGVDGVTCPELLCTSSLPHDVGMGTASLLEAFATYVVSQTGSASEIRSGWTASLVGESPLAATQLGLLDTLEAWLPRCEGTDEVRPSFVLGSYSCKDWRTYTRGALRYLYPLLDVTTLPNSSVLVAYPCMERYEGDAAILRGGIGSVAEMIRASLLASPLGALRMPPLPPRSPLNPSLEVAFVEGATATQQEVFWRTFQSKYGVQPTVTSRGASVFDVAFTRSAAAGAKRERDVPAALYTHMVAHATNMDFMEMGQIIAQGLSLVSRTNVGSAGLCIAGIKDKRAITHQRMSIKGDFATLLKSQKEVRLVDDRSNPANPRALSLTHIQSRPYPLSLGQLGGNGFNINVCLNLGAVPTGVDDKQLRAAIQTAIDGRIAALSTNGFPNFFGLQRFNKQPAIGVDPTVITRHSGMYMMRGDYISAVDSVLFGEGGNDYPAFGDLKAELKLSWDVEGVSKKAPSGMRDWSAVVGGLKTAIKRRGAVLDAASINEAREYNTRWVVYFAGGAPLEGTPTPQSHTTWAAICKDAILSLPFHLTQLWVYSAQSLVYNLTLSNAVLRGDRHATLPLIPACPTSTPSKCEDGKRCLDDFVAGVSDLPEERAALVSAMTLPGCPMLSAAPVYPQSGGLPTKVGGVPLKRSERQASVVPTSLSLHGLSHKVVNGEVVASMTLVFDLPSSCYATVLLASLFGIMPTG